MTFKCLQFSFCAIFLVSGVTACTTNQMASDKGIREIGYVESVTQDGEPVDGIPIDRVSHYKYSEILAAKESLKERRKVFSNLPPAQEAFNVIANFKKGGSAIVSRILVAGFAESFDDKVDILFKIQPCRNIEVNRDGSVCLDQPLQPAITAERTLVLAGGKSVVVDFPLGVKWKYEVFDRKLP